MSNDAVTPIKNKELVLVVEDSLHNRNVLVHTLKKLGFEVKEAPDGEAAWAILEECKKTGEKIEAVFSDIMMPKMNGNQLLEKVRGDELYKDIKFVLITAVADKDYIVHAKTFRVNGYLLKPITYEKIRKKAQDFFPVKVFPKLAV